jgi:hypothetical protein
MDTDRYLDLVQEHFDRLRERFRGAPFDWVLCEAALSARRQLVRIHLMLSGNDATPN